MSTQKISKDVEHLEETLSIKLIWVKSIDCYLKQNAHFFKYSLYLSKYKSYSGQKTSFIKLESICVIQNMLCNHIVVKLKSNNRKTSENLKYLKIKYYTSCWSQEKYFKKQRYFELNKNVGCKQYLREIIATMVIFEKEINQEFQLP